MSDPIAAIATGSAAAAIGIVRVSGSGCFAACDRVFRPKNGKPFALQPSHRMVFGEMLDSHSRVLDQGLAVRFDGSHSYTGEDSAEFHCHGSPVVLRELLSALFAAGVRQAEAGEFTRRAFLNGRLDLTESEAVIDLVDAQTASAARNAAAQLQGGLRRRLEPVQTALTEVISRFYAVVDYPDEDIEDIHPQQIAAALAGAEQSLAALLSTTQRGRVLKNGVRTAIIGRPNAGKSSLLNALAGYERAIVTDIPGTTRDTVEESVLCGDLLLRLVDTAGIRKTEDTVEQLGVARSHRAAESADLVLAVADGAAPLTEEDWEIFRLAARAPRWICVLSKQDLAQAAPPALPPEFSPAAVVPLSSVTGAGLPDLERAMTALFPAGAESGSLLTNARQESAVRQALSAVQRAMAAQRDGLTPDAILTDAEDALDALGTLTGQSAREEIVSAIFSRFCVGK